MQKSIKILAVFLYVGLLISASFSPFGEQQFTYLAKAFLSGRLGVNQGLYLSDMSFFNGNYYWPLGLFPAVLVSPLVYVGGLFNILFFHKYIHWLLCLGVFCLVYQIARKLKFNKTDSLILSFAFNLGSVFVGVSFIPWSWYYAQVVCTLLIFWVIYEYLGKKRYLLLGLIFALIFLTRSTAVLGIVFVVLGILGSGEILSKKITKIATLMIPVMISGVIFISYNYLRFGNIFEQGYSYQKIEGATKKAREYGLVSFKHVPGNLYYFAIASPKPILNDGQSRVLKFPYFTYDDWGMGILFTSGYMLSLFFTNFKNKLNRNLLIAALITAIPLFLYYGIGFRQYGYRYSLDFLPYMFLILMNSYREKGLSNKIKIAIVFSIFLNTYLLFSRIFV